MIIARDIYGFKAEISDYRAMIAPFGLSLQSNNLCVSIFKQMMLLNFIIANNDTLPYKTFMQSIIYDVLSSQISILNKRERYFHLNIRSIIEHTARISLQKVDNGGEFDLFVRKDDFENLKSVNANEDWIYLHQNYTQSCAWVHASAKAKININATFNELLNSDSRSSIDKQITHLHKIASEVLSILFNYYHTQILSSFYRNLNDLKYLLGKSLYTIFHERFCK